VPVRVASAPPARLVLVVVLACVVVVEEGVVLAVLVRCVLVTGGMTLETDTVFVEPEPQPLSASSPRPVARSPVADRIVIRILFVAGHSLPRLGRSLAGVVSVGDAGRGESRTRPPTGVFGAWERPISLKIISDC
jgi:hypothetical protein